MVSALLKYSASVTGSLRDLKCVERATIKSECQAMTDLILDDVAVCDAGLLLLSLVCQFFDAGMCGVLSCVY